MWMVTEYQKKEPACNLLHEEMGEISQDKVRDEKPRSEAAPKKAMKRNPTALNFCSLHCLDYFG